MTKISVIIPVYNADKHLDACITSLVNQTFSDCEFIFVNDGSKDNSQNSIERHQKNDSRIKLINQENQGVSVARNNGLHIATGDYIGFVDADDYVKNDFFENLVSSIEKHNSDIVVSNFFTETNGKFKTVNSKFKKDTVFNTENIQNELLPEFIKSSSLNSVCNKLYKSFVLKEVTFPVGVALGEDGIFNLQAFKNSNSVLFITYSGYFYKEVEGSATKNVKGKDYFQRALDGYDFDFNDYFSFPNEQVQKWKSIRLIENVIALVHIYFKKNNGLTFFKKIKRVNQMIKNETVQKSIAAYFNEIIESKSSYQRTLLKLIQLKAVFLLFILISYSQFRNKQ